MTEQQQWENFGDVNPIPHGGFWVKKVGETEYEYVSLDLMDGTSYLISSGKVDLSDNWIEWEKIFKSCDINESAENQWKVKDVVWYYGHHNFGGEHPDYEFKYNSETENEEEIKEALKSWGIEI